jgi:hypothetical protein
MDRDRMGMIQEQTSHLTPGAVAQILLFVHDERDTKGRAPLYEQINGLMPEAMVNIVKGCYGVTCNLECIL